jgi:hypothetical protein
MTMSTTVHTTGGPAPATTAPGLLGSWVEAHEETCRGGRTYRVLVNHRTGQATELTTAEAALCDQLTGATGGGAASPEAATLLEDLREQGFLAASPPLPPSRRRLEVSLSRLDLRWNGAGRLVRAVHDRGARHLFHPAAVTAQIILALAGLAALAATLVSHQHFQLRVHPAQIPIVIGLSLAAIGVHEFAHALVVVHHGRSVDGAGVRLHLGTPAFYVESVSALLLPRRHRLIQAAAGVWAEWQFTSIIAIWLWRSPLPFAIPLLHRFVILNAATIASNLAPFTGLDGSWILADTVRAPDLARRSRGSVSRLLTALASRQPATGEDHALAAYATLNGLVAAGLLATGGFFWYQLFGDLAATLTHHGPAGWLVLTAAAAVLAMPALTATAPRLAQAAASARALHDAITFRLQWKWRIPATRHLAAAFPQIARLSQQELGILAGHLHRTRRRLDARPSYGVVRAGTLTATTSSGGLVTLGPGATWDPSHQLHQATRRATLVQIEATALHQLLTPSPAQT